MEVEIFLLRLNSKRETSCTNRSDVLGSIPQGNLLNLANLRP